MYCHECGKEITKENATFCQNCGASLNQENTPQEIKADPQPVPAQPASPKQPVTVKPKKNGLLLAAALLGTVYLIFLIYHFFGGIATSVDEAELLGSGLATAIVMPHLVCVALAVIFNWLGWTLNASWGALVAGILYAVSMVFMFLYAFYVLLQMIFCFIAYGSIKKAQQVQNK